MIQAARQYPRVLAAREAFLLCPCCLMIHHGGVESKSWLKSGLTLIDALFSANLILQLGPHRIPTKGHKRSCARNTNKYYYDRNTTMTKILLFCVYPFISTIHWAHKKVVDLPPSIPRYHPSSGIIDPQPPPTATASGIRRHDQQPQ